MAMATAAAALLLFLLSAATVPSPAVSAGSGARFATSFHHRFSPRVLRWAESFGSQWPAPPLNSLAAAVALASHDAEHHGLIFAQGNSTRKFSALGFLYYAFVTIGTPGVTFMVALDTGSDLFWLPCDSATPGLESIYYSPKLSSTSHQLPCNSYLCDLSHQCSLEGQCPYRVSYVSADTSSTGYLVEDVLYLLTEASSSEVVQSQVVFGCGQVQTGSLLDSAAPYGLFGLGLKKISVPSILSSGGLIPSSFSMCFGRDGIGRLSFGDQGSLDQEETPLDNQSPTYSITVIGSHVGNSNMNMTFSTLVDTGTSFTHFDDPAYTYVTRTFDAQIRAERCTTDSRIPFEYCYNFSSSNFNIKIPDITFTTAGGSLFRVNDPGQVVSVQRNDEVFCLAILRSSKLNIIGQNFLTGLNVVFDRERMILGWKSVNCYDATNSSPHPVSPGASSSHHASSRPEVNSQPVGSSPNENSKCTLNCPSLANSISSVLLMSALLIAWPP